MKKGYVRGDLMRIIKNLFLVSFVAYSSVFATDLETETKSEKKATKSFTNSIKTMDQKPRLKTTKSFMISLKIAL